MAQIERSETVAQLQQIDPTLLRTRLIANGFSSQEAQKLQIVAASDAFKNVPIEQALLATFSGQEIRD